MQSASGNAASAIERADRMAQRLVAIAAMRQSSQMVEFNKQYKRRRMEATLCGRGFMTYAQHGKAATRPHAMLAAGDTRPAIGRDLFSSIFS